MSLERFVEAQQHNYEIAKEELSRGKKESHWIWYIFPQLKGLGMSSTSNYYGIRDIEEAKEYYSHPILGKRLIELTKIVLNINTDDIHKIMPFPDDLKLRSSMTLFYAATGDELFMFVINKYYDGQLDRKTLRLLKLN